MIFVEKIAHMHWVEARLLSLADQMTQIVVFWPQFPNKLLTLKSCGGQHLVCKKKRVEALTSEHGVVGIHMRAVCHAEDADGGIQIPNHASPQ